MRSFAAAAVVLFVREGGTVCGSHGGSFTGSRVTVIERLLFDGLCFLRAHTAINKSIATSEQIWLPDKSTPIKGDWRVDNSFQKTILNFATPVE